MNRSAARRRTLAAAACVLAASSAGAAERMRDCEVIARVNHQVIQSCDLAWEVELALQRRLAQMPPDVRAQAEPELDAAREALKQQLLMGRLDMMLFYADFRASVPEADLPRIHQSLLPQWLAREVPRLQKMVGAEDLAGLKSRLAELGTSFAERQTDFYEKSIAQAWLQESVQFNREVTHEDMLAHYREHRDEYAFPARVRWEELVVRFDRHASPAAAYRAAAALGNRAYAVAASRPAAEPAFAELAKAESDGFTAAAGGRHDWTTRGSMAVEEIDRLLFTQAPGGMSPIVEGPTGFHIVRVLEREPAGVTPFREVQKAIAAKIKDDRFDAAVLRRVTELKRDARIWTVYTGDLDTSRVAATPENTLR